MLVMPRKLDILRPLRPPFVPVIVPFDLIPMTVTVMGGAPRYGVHGIPTQS